MATNGGKKTATKKPGTRKPTVGQQRARREYVKMTGHKIDPSRIAKIRSEWVD